VDAPPSTDDLCINGEDLVFRRIAHADSVDMVTVDQVDGSRRPSSGVFIANEDGLSVYLSMILAHFALGPEALLRAPNNAVLSLAVSVLRSHGLGVVPDAWPSDTDDPKHLRNAAHALVTGIDRFGSKAERRVRQALARSATLVIDPGA